jgi:hypothetical protein
VSKPSSFLQRSRFHGKADFAVDGASCVTLTRRGAMPALRAESRTAGMEVICHTLRGYFSQRTGLLLGAMERSSCDLQCGTAQRWRTPTGTATPMWNDSLDAEWSSCGLRCGMTQRWRTPTGTTTPMWNDSLDAELSSGHGRAANNTHKDGDC